MKWEGTVHWTVLKDQLWKWLDLGSFSKFLLSNMYQALVNFFCQTGPITHAEINNCFSLWRIHLAKIISSIFFSSLNITQIVSLLLLTVSVWFCNDTKILCRANPPPHSSPLAGGRGDEPIKGSRNFCCFFFPFSFENSEALKTVTTIVILFELCLKNSLDYYYYYYYYYYHNNIIIVAVVVVVVVFLVSPAKAKKNLTLY